MALRYKWVSDTWFYTYITENPDGDDSSSSDYKTQGQLCFVFNVILGLYGISFIRVGTKIVCLYF